MPRLKGYNRADMGLGVGGNPNANTLIMDKLNDNKDAYGPIHEKGEVTITPPQEKQVKTLHKKDFLEIMNNKE